MMEIDRKAVADLAAKFATWPDEKIAEFFRATIVLVDAGGTFFLEILRETVTAAVEMIAAQSGEAFADLLGSILANHEEADMESRWVAVTVIEPYIGRGGPADKRFWNEFVVNDETKEWAKIRLLDLLDSGLVTVEQIEAAGYGSNLAALIADQEMEQ